MAVAVDPPRAPVASDAEARRWPVLGVVALAQLMVALDATIVSIALPSAQRALHASDAERQWVVTAYTLAFGCLLLVGGRVADSVGRKRAFLAGLAGFAIASAIGGAAPALPVLVAARALQGAFAALLAPTALSLLAVTFTEPRERARAFAVYGTIAGTGAVVGLLLGGVLTQYLAWRWCLYVNVPVAAAAALGGWLWFRGDEPVRGARRRLDLPRALLAAAGLAALVFACASAVSDGWASPAVAGLLALCVGLLAVFLVRDARAASPLLPLRIVRHRARGGVYAVVALAIAGMFGAFLLLTYYLQSVLRYSPVEAGLAFLPITVASQAGSWAIASRLMPFVAPRALMAPGALVAATGMGILALGPASAGYAGHVPAELLLGAGISCVMVPAFSTATLGVDPREAGAASAIVNTAQQVGGSVGTALLNTVAAVLGYAAAAGAGAVILAAAALVAAVAINAGRPTPRVAGRAPGGTGGRDSRH
jgi:EmrB/QacA subfamily drug resistance transporter